MRCKTQKNSTRKSNAKIVRSVKTTADAQRCRQHHVYRRPFYNDAAELAVSAISLKSYVDLCALPALPRRLFRPWLQIFAADVIEPASARQAAAVAMQVRASR